MLARIERTTRVEFDEWKWKVSYALPLHGKDYWTERMEKMEEEAREREAQMRKEKEKEIVSRKKSLKRFSWKRKSTRAKGVVKFADGLS